MQFTRKAPAASLTRISPTPELSAPASVVGIKDPVDLETRRPAYARRKGAQFIQRVAQEADCFSLNDYIDFDIGSLRSNATDR
jgi:hypothetical protein